ncbi:hypothetical protein L2E82_20299 [Cichorium intybus]|uniref:Uncharacterized protein n=1 Tax=Cichorium intybus TaxID=13427 RepID=A0ACB9DT76_CICIN|nr:hypothetical protein L2E82_20299 [Cichorium intybus]
MDMCFRSVSGEIRSFGTLNCFLTFYHVLLYPSTHWLYLVQPDGFLSNCIDFLLITLGWFCAVVHGASLVVYLHLFGKIIHLLSLRTNADDLFDHFSQYALYIVYIG